MTILICILHMQKLLQHLLETVLAGRQVTAEFFFGVVLLEKDCQNSLRPPVIQVRGLSVAMHGDCRLQLQHLLPRLCKTSRYPHVPMFRHS
jgi:hypothetical protein